MRYRVKSESSASFTDLREGPTVLIGAFNNDWTMRLTGNLRFSFEHDAASCWIRDRQQPAQRDWLVDMAQPYGKTSKDYALISRVLDPTTERVLVVVAGIAHHGTTAAGECLVDTDCMESAARQLPPGWERKNIQIVLTTHVINGTSGPPRLVAAHAW